MIDPSWLGDVLAGVVLATALYCVGRIVVSLVARRRIELHADVMHILTGVAMAGMFVTGLAVFDPGVWAAVFGLAAAWYVFRIVRESAGGAGGGRWLGLRHHAGHLLSVPAMLYMLLAVPAGFAPSSSTGMGSATGGGSGMGASVPTLALLFALSLFGYAVLVADRIPLTAAAIPAPSAPTSAAATGSSAAGEGAGGMERGCGVGLGRGALLAPRGSAVCEVVMSVAMGVMLIAVL